MNYLGCAPQTNRSQPNYPDSQSVLRTITRQGYKLWSPLFYHYSFILLYYKHYLFLPGEQNGHDLSQWMIQLTLNLSTQSPAFLQFLQKLSQNSQKYFFLLCNSKEKSRTVKYGTTQYKSRRRLKGPRRPTEPSDLLDFEKAARLRQQPQPFRSFLHGLRFI